MVARSVPGAAVEVAGGGGGGGDAVAGVGEGWGGASGWVPPGMVGSCCSVGCGVGTRSHGSKPSVGGSGPRACGGWFVSSCVCDGIAGSGAPVGWAAFSGTKLWPMVSNASARKSRVPDMLKKTRVDAVTVFAVVVVER